MFIMLQQPFLNIVRFANIIFRLRNRMNNIKKMTHELNFINQKTPKIIMKLRVVSGTSSPDASGEPGTHGLLFIQNIY